MDGLAISLPVLGGDEEDESEEEGFDDPDPDAEPDADAVDSAAIVGFSDSFAARSEADLEDSAALSLSFDSTSLSSSFFSASFASPSSSAWFSHFLSLPRRLVLWSPRDANLLSMLACDGRR